MSDYDTEQRAIQAANIKKLLELLSDYRWRIHNLYKIKDPSGLAIPFVPNYAQEDFIDEMHYFNLILKARQLGFTTFIDIHGLDRCIFHANQSFGIIAQGMSEAQGMLANCRYTYNALPDFIKANCRIIKDNTETIEFSNGSKIVADISLRSGTYQILHISEFGKTSVKFPDKAKEIKTGALNTVHVGNQIFVESTAEGQAGEFFDMTTLARKIEDEGRELSPLDFKFHFYAWHSNPNYVLSDEDTARTVINEEHQQYFADLEKNDFIILSANQKAWYVKKAETQGEDMYREFPSTPDEAFKASVEGAIYAKEMRLMRKAKRITQVPWEPTLPVYTFWDFGNVNYMAIWFFQQVGRERRMIRYHQNTGQGFKEYIQYCIDLGYLYGGHYVPHDGGTVRMMETGNKTYKQVMEAGGLSNIKIVPVTKSTWMDIETRCKPELGKIWIDEVNCADGIKCLDNYKKERNKDGIWLPEPKHDEFSDGSDAFRTYAVGWKEIAPALPPASMKLPSGHRQL